MTITGFTSDSTSNGIDFVTTAKTGLTAVITNEVLCLSGQSARLAGTLTISGSQISVFNPIPGLGNNVTNTSILNGTVTVQNQSAIFLNSESYTPVGGTGSDRIQMQLLTIRDSIVVEQNKAACIVYLLANATVLNSSFRGVKWLETTGAIAAFAGNSLLETALGVLNYQNGTQDLVGLNIPSTTTGYFGALGEGAANSSFRIWNPVAFNFAKILHSSSTSFAIQGYSATIRIRDSGGFVNSAGVFYKDDRVAVGEVDLIASYLTNSSGILTGAYNSQTGVTGTNIARPTLWIQTAKTRLTGAQVAQNPANTLYTAVTVGGSYREFVAVIDNISSEIEIRSYLHLVTEKLLTPTTEAGKINADGSVNFYLDSLLELDTGVTQTNTATVAAYTGFAHTASTIIISEARIISETYDSRKLHWRNTDGITPPTRSGNIADFGNANIVINATVTADSKYTQIRTSGIVTFGVSGAVSFTIQDANGFRFRVFGLPVGAEANAKIRVEDTVTSAVTVYPALTGEVFINLIPGRPYKFRADARGFRASDSETLSTSDRTSLQYNLEQFLDDQGSPLYAQGNAAIAALFSLNPVTYQISINATNLAPAVIDFATAVMALELLQNGTPENEAAVLDLTARIYPQNGIIVFPNDSVTGDPNPATVIPVGKDVLLNFSALDESNPNRPDRLFPVSNGFVVRVPYEANFANVNISGGGATPEEIRQEIDANSTQLIAIKAKTDPLVFVSGDVRATLDGEAVSLSSGAFLETDRTKLNSIPTNPLLVGDARLNFLDASIDSRAVAADLIVTLQGGFEPGDRAALQNKLNITDYTAPNNNGISTLLNRATEARFSKLDVPGTLANTENADFFKASGFSVHSAADVFALINPELSEFDTDLVAIQTAIDKLLKPVGLYPGVTATQLDPKPGVPGYLRTSGDNPEDEINLVLTKNPDTSVSIVLED